MRRIRLPYLGFLLLALACSESTGEPFEGCADLATQCAPTAACASTDCSFDASVIDCPTACANLLAVCAAGCPESNACTRSLSLEGCLQECDTAPSDSCGNAKFGCYTLNESCTSISLCVNCE